MKVALCHDEIGTDQSSQLRSRAWAATTAAAIGCCSRGISKRACVQLAVQDLDNANEIGNS
jgi:hypothetical protein